MINSSSTPAFSNQPFMLAGATIVPMMNLVKREGKHVQVERQVMRLLLFLVKHENQTVTREYLLENLWDNQVPNDEALTQAMSKLRKALGDSAGQGRVIQTIRKVGYLLKGPVVYDTTVNGGFEPDHLPVKGTKKQRAIYRRIGVTLVVIAGLSNFITVRTATDQDMGNAHDTNIVRMVITRNHVQTPVKNSTQEEMQDTIDENSKGWSDHPRVTE